MLFATSCPFVSPVRAFSSGKKERSCFHLDEWEGLATGRAHIVNECRLIAPFVRLHSPSRLGEWLSVCPPPCRTGQPVRSSSPHSQPQHLSDPPCHMVPDVEAFLFSRKSTLGTVCRHMWNVPNSSSPWADASFAGGGCMEEGWALVFPASIGS